MALDSGRYDPITDSWFDRNEQIDFVWGNVPLQPNYDWNEEVNFRGFYLAYPGDGEAEYYLKGHDGGVVPSPFLNVRDSHRVALRQWSAYPSVEENVGDTLLTPDGWWYWNAGEPAAQAPNIIGLNVEDALAQYRELGIAPEHLTDLLTDAENPYDYGTPINGGVVIWRYYEPDTVIGQHWDGSDWYAYESENCVQDTAFWVGFPASVDAVYEDGVPWQWIISVIQTKDPDKNSWNWWN